MEVTYLTWIDDGLLRQFVYEGLREDKPTRDVARPLATAETKNPGGISGKPAISPAPLMHQQSSPSRGRRGDLVEGEALGFGADLGRVSRAPHELCAARNCTRDEGGPFEFGELAVA